MIVGLWEILKGEQPGIIKTLLNIDLLMIHEKGIFVFNIKTIAAGYSGMLSNLIGHKP